MVKLSWSTRNLGTDQLNLWTKQNIFIILILHDDFFITSMRHSMDSVLYFK